MCLLWTFSFDDYFMCLKYDNLEHVCYVEKWFLINQWYFFFIIHWSMPSLLFLFFRFTVFSKRKVQWGWIIASSKVEKFFIKVDNLKRIVLKIEQAFLYYRNSKVFAVRRLILCNKCDWSTQNNNFPWFKITDLNANVVVLHFDECL